MQQIDQRSGRAQAGGMGDPAQRRQRASSFARYVAFITANPTWPSIGMLRRRAEGDAVAGAARSRRRCARYFGKDRPLTAKGRFALARALLLQGDRAGAQSLVREAWRNDDSPASSKARCSTSSAT